MLHKPVTLLMVEDNPCDAELLEISLRSETHSETQIERVKRLGPALEILRERAFDLILLDLTLPDAQGLPVFVAIAEAAPRTPIVILTGLADARLAVETVRLGAQDYLVKDEVEGRALGRALAHAIERKKVQLEAEEMRQRKTEFIAMVSHELRNPMTGVVGFIHLLSKTSLDEVQREYVEAAQAGAQSLLDLLNNLLDLSSAESGHVALDLQPLDLRDCLEATATFTAPQARSKGLELVASIDPRIPDLVMGDNLRLRQVLINLLGNAMKFTDHGYVGLFARLRSLTESEAVVRFVVEDSGRGIPPEKKISVFQAFSQAHRDDRARGAGLGLAISKQLISAMGGVLGVESEVGEGTAFWFDLHFSVLTPSGLSQQLEGTRVLVLESHPQSEEALLYALGRMGAEVHTRPGQPCDLVITDQPLTLSSSIPHLVFCHERTQALPMHAHYIARPLRLGDLQPVKKTESAVPEAARQSQSGRILVVDDDPLCRQLVAAIAGQCGFRVDCAGDGAEAMDFLGEHTYLMVFLDHHLPDCTGADLAARIRGQGQCAPLISLSGSEKACHPQYHGCLPKPVDPAALERLLQLPPAVDWSVLDRFKKYQTGSNQNLIRDLILAFTSTAPERSRALHEARSPDEVRRVAHLIKGAAASVGAVVVAEAAAQVEEAPEQVHLVDALRFEVVRSLQVFQEYLEGSLSGAGAA